MRSVSCAAVAALLVACAGGLEQSEDEGPLGELDDGLGAPFSVSVQVAAPPATRWVSPGIWGVNGGLTAGADGGRTLQQWREYVAPDAPHQADARVRRLGIKQLRFPGGCGADTFDWKTSTHYRYADDGGTAVIKTPRVSVRDALDYADSIGAELVYTMNVETRGLPNPCGERPAYPGRATEAENKRILLADARLLLSQPWASRIRHIELGNEPWGAWAKMPRAYFETAHEFAALIKSIDPYIHVSVAGSPTTGNNMAGAPDSGMPTPDDVEWTKVAREYRTARCSYAPCFDAITDHPYGWAGWAWQQQNIPNPASFPGASAYYALTNAWAMDKRLADYAGSDLSLSEWNLKCWESGSIVRLGLINPGFEAGAVRWTAWERFPEGRDARGAPIDENRIEVVTTGARVGSSAMKVRLGRATGNWGDTVQAAQSVDVRGNRRVIATLWVKTNQPRNTQVILQQTNPGAHQWWHVAEDTLETLRPNTWQGVTITGDTFADTTQLSLVLRVHKNRDEWGSSPAAVEAYFDGAELRDVTDQVGWAVPSVNTAEHGFYVFENLMLMAQKGVAMAHYHAFSRGRCGLLNPRLPFSGMGQAFSLTSAAAGGTVLDTKAQGPVFRVPSHGCTSLACVPANAALPFVSAYAVLDEDQHTVHVFLANRHTARPAAVTVGFSGLDMASRNALEVTTLRAPDFATPGFTESATTSLRPSPGALLSVTVPPVGLVRATLRLDRTYTVEGVPTCDPGKTLAQGTERARLVYAFWPPGNLTWASTALKVGAVATGELRPAHPLNALYVYMQTETGEVLPPFGAPPHAGIVFADVFNPRTWMAQLTATKVPSGTWRIRYRAPPRWCR